jgi:uncharacterized protein
MTYERIDVPLASPVPGVNLKLTAHRFGRIEDARSLYIQAGLHGDEHARFAAPSRRSAYA